MTEKVKKLDIILLVEDEEDHAELIITGLKNDGNLMNEIKWVENGPGSIFFIVFSLMFYIIHCLLPVFHPFYFIY